MCFTTPAPKRGRAFGAKNTKLCTRTFQVALVCPACARRGDARWETVSTNSGGKTRNLVGLSEGFSSRDLGADRPIQIICGGCKVDVPIPS
jgi:hypothetical protein